MGGGMLSATHADDRHRLIRFLGFRVCVVTKKVLIEALRRLEE
jgi:hypothetical protein